MPIPTEFAFPAVEALLSDLEFAADLGYRYAGLGLPQSIGNLLLGEAIAFHRDLIRGPQNS